jgi:diaminopimelate decarboxylase
MNDTRAVPTLGFPVVDDCLQIGGRSLTALAQQVGRTPFYAYDKRLVAERIGALRRALPDEIHLHYAIKANPMPALLRSIVPQVDGLDVASGGELRVALEAAMAPRQISFAGPGKRPEELAQAIDAGVVINMESENEMETIARLAQAKGVRPPVAIRVNPDFELKTSGMKMSGGPKQFGVDAERVPEMLARLKTLALEFVGFHIFSGSQNLSAAAIQDAQSKTFDLAFALAEHTPAPVRLLNIGGGFGIPYFPGEKPLDLAAISAHLHTLLPQARLRFPKAEFVIELGRYIVGEAGIYVCRVVDRKISRGHVFLVTDGGLHHHLAASGNFGQVLRKNYPVLVGNKVVGRERETVSVVGPLCTPLDLLADKVEMARAEVGDLIVVLQSGAYGFTASPTAFLSHPPPAEVLV